MRDARYIKTRYIKNSSPRSERGFTLIEILIVIAIISTVIAVAIPAIERVTFQRISSTARKFVGMIRTVRNDAILLNNIYRIGFDIEKNQYWIQSQRELKTIKEKYDTKEEAQKEASNFVYAEKYSKQALEMPGGTKVLGVFKEGDGLLQKGLAIIHFFPNGFNEPAIIYLAKDGSTQAAYSLTIQATGKAEVFPGVISSLDGAK